MIIQPNKWYVILCAYGEYSIDEDLLKDRYFFNTKAEALNSLRGTRCSDAGTEKLWAGCYEFQGRDLICTGASLLSQGFEF